MDGVLIAILLAFYFFPTLTAFLNRHHNAPAIFVLNLLLGWMLIPWVIALVWACTAPAPARAYR